MIKTDNRTSQHRLSDKPVPLTHAAEQPDKLSLLTSALVLAHELSSWVIPIAAAAERLPSPCSATSHHSAIHDWAKYLETRCEEFEYIFEKSVWHSSFIVC